VRLGEDMRGLTVLPRRTVRHAISQFEEAGYVESLARPTLRGVCVRASGFGRGAVIGHGLSGSGVG